MNVKYNLLNMSVQFSLILHSLSTADKNALMIQILQIHFPAIIQFSVHFKFYINKYFRISAYLKTKTAKICLKIETKMRISHVITQNNAFLFWNGFRKRIFWLFSSKCFICPSGYTNNINMRFVNLDFNTWVLRMRIF